MDTKKNGFTGMLISFFLAAVLLLAGYFETEEKLANLSFVGAGLMVMWGFFEIYLDSIIPSPAEKNPAENPK